MIPVAELPSFYDTVSALTDPTAPNRWGNLIELSAALLTPVIAIAAVLIAFLQVRINQQRLKLELFEKRHAIYKATEEYLGHCLKSDAPGLEASLKYWSVAKASRFLMDKKFSENLWKIYERGNRLDLYSKLISEKVDPKKHKENVEKQHEVSIELVEISKDLAKLFEPWLRVGHHVFR